MVPLEPHELAASRNAPVLPDGYRWVKVGGQYLFPVYEGRHLIDDPDGLVDVPTKMVGAIVSSRGTHPGPNIPMAAGLHHVDGDRWFVIEVRAEETSMTVVHERTAEALKALEAA